MAQWTVDVENDWGGRTQGTKGIDDGLPRILETFDRFGIQGIFFISTELLELYPSLPAYLRLLRHTVGSHGHFHVRYKERWRAEEDKELSLNLLNATEYRAPWFNYETDSVYSRRENHVSILKKSWFGDRINDNSIFYIHPFDIVGGDRAPSLFTRILYSRPNHVWDTFNMLCRLYPGKTAEQVAKSS